MLVNKDTPEGEKPQDLTIQERVNIATDHLGKTEWLKVAKDTAKDLATKDELKRLPARSSRCRAGLPFTAPIAWPKHRKEKLAEDAQKAKKPGGPKPPKAA